MKYTDTIKSKIGSEKKRLLKRLIVQTFPRERGRIQTRERGRIQTRERGRIQAREC